MNQYLKRETNGIKSKMKSASKVLEHVPFVGKGLKTGMKSLAQNNSSLGTQIIGKVQNIKRSKPLTRKTKQKYKKMAQLSQNPQSNFKKLFKKRPKKDDIEIMRQLMNQMVNNQMVNNQMVNNQIENRQLVNDPLEVVLPFGQSVDE